MSRVRTIADMKIKNWSVCFRNGPNVFRKSCQLIQLGYTNALMKDLGGCVEYNGFIALDMCK